MKTEYTTENKVKCDACQKMVQAESVNTDWADNGWILDIDSFGYYGGFHDGFPEQGTRFFIMCQDCVKQMISLFPTMINWIDGGMQWKKH
jgi:hypothetical protein